MQYFKYSLIAAILCIYMAACVQPVHKKVVVYTVKVSGIDSVEMMAIRGPKPLSWNSDSVLTTIIPDSLYTITVTYTTGYNFTEAKFVANGNFELKGKDNRTIDFAPNSDTTFYNCVFDKE
jgi:hypothetical protein